jgi:hypothetical protein
MKRRKASVTGSNPASAARKPARLKKELATRLAAYASAAATAGFGVLAGAPQAKAEIVYTPRHMEISHFGYHGIDLNHDGMTDFGLQPFDNVFKNGYAFSLGLNVNEGADGLGVIGTKRVASALPRGATIGPADSFQNGPQLLLRSRGTYSGFVTATGPWLNTRDRYLGLKFKINGQVHYGWVELANPYGFVGPWLLGFAYNTVANQPIMAGQTSAGDDGIAAQPESPTLGQLALGSLGLGFWRRQKENLEWRRKSNGSEPLA